ncbi:MAG TPA: N-acetylmuramoyl-L-alanine amidase, partial [Gemmatimonadaceae bacterium]|nr:N-acetylmuramoyl-L-alanine amidase [Gemmatimonadaceae bacterium]
ARDSTFLFGSVGSGLASLTINGAAVPVNPNGSFLAWLPFPAGDKPKYELVAKKGESEVTSALEVARPAVPAPLPETGKLVVDRKSVLPDSGLRLRGDEIVRVGIRAPANATVAARLADGSVRELVAGAGQLFRADVPARLLAKPVRLAVSRGKESITLTTPPVALVDADAPRFVELKNSNVDAKGDTDAVTIVRPSIGGTYKWFLFPGTVLETTGSRPGWTRVRLDETLEAWVESRDAAPVERAAGVRRTAGNARVVTGERSTDVRIPVGERPAWAVDASADALTLTLYGTVSDVDIVNMPTSDPSVRDLTWEQVGSDRVRLTVHLKHAPYGWLALWDRGTFVLRVRRPPAVDPARPLAGKVVAIDAGHPPIGSTGPTGLYEGDAVLAVANALRPMLEREGATVVMTRSAPGPVALGARPIIARRADADVFVSIHLNAHPDGVNPYRTNGSGTYYFHDQSASLARFVQQGLVRWMGLRDLGVNYDNLAVARQTWMPAILCEGAFVILPDQEAALRTPEFQSRYAIGILEGLEQWFRSLAPPHP